MIFRHNPSDKLLKIAREVFNNEATDRTSWLELLLPAVDAVGDLVFAVEGLVGELVLAVGAHEALRVPPLVQGVQDGAGREGLCTLGTDSARHGFKSIRRAHALRCFRPGQINKNSIKPGLGSFNSFMKMKCSLYIWIFCFRV